jgi:hypothetical protein
VADAQHTEPLARCCTTGALIRLCLTFVCLLPMVMLPAINEHDQCTPHASRACCHVAVVYHHIDTDIAKLGTHTREWLHFVHECTP